MRRLITAFLVLLTSFSYAQKKQPIRVEQGAAFLIDGAEQDWRNVGDVADEGRWFYKLAHDHDNFYVAVRIVDELLQNYAVRDGINVQFLGESKKKKDRSFVYPFPDREVKRAVQQADFDPAKDYKTDLIARSRGYYVTGFPSIVDGLLSFQNNYGFKAEAKVVSNELLYVATLPKVLMPIVDNGFMLKLSINDGLSALLQAANKKGAPTQAVIQGLQVEKGQDKTKKKATTSLLLQAVLVN